MRTSGFYPLLLALGTMTAVAPVAWAAPYHNASTLSVPLGTLATQDGHRYQVDLLEGDSVTVTLSWTSGSADMDVAASGPGLGCAPSVACTLERTTCTGGEPDSNERGLGPSAESLTFVAPQAGTYSLYALVAAGTGTPTVAYEITVDVNDGDGQGLVTGPTYTTVSSPWSYCELV